MSIWRWNNFILVGDGNFLRSYAKEHNLFLYPYDILTGSDIALFETEKEWYPNKRRYIVCTLAEMKIHTLQGKESYRITPSPWFIFTYDSREEAIAQWNKRVQTTAQRMIISFPWRFFAMEYGTIIANVLGWGLVFFLFVINPYLRNH